MRQIRLVVLLLTMAVVWGFASTAHAEWVYTKETGWINMNTAIRRSVKEIYDDASKAFEEKRWNDAYNDYRLIATYLPESRYTEEAMYRCGECLYQLDRYNSSYRFFKDYLNYYPGTRRIDDVIARMHEIGKALLEGHNYDWEIAWGLTIPWFSNRRRGVDILSEIVDNYPYTPESYKALITIADYYYDAREYDDAIHQYQKLLDLYSQIDERDWAAFRIGECYRKSYEGPSYTHESLPKAYEAYRQYGKQFTGGKFNDTATERMSEIEALLAEKELLTAQYYHRVHETLAAVTTLKALQRLYPNTPAAAQAKELIEQWQPAADTLGKKKQALLDRETARAHAEREKEIADKEARKDRQRASMERTLAKDRKRAEREAAKEQAKKEQGK